MLSAAVTSQTNKKVDKTKAKRIRAWDKWCKFLRSIGLRSNVFLDGFSRWKRQLVLVAFTQAARQAGFLPGPKNRLIAETVRDTVGYLSQAFKEFLRDNPKKESDGSLSFLLEQTFKGSEDEDPGVKQQKGLPIIVILKVLNLDQKDLAIAMAELICDDFFFAMRPYKYTKMPETAENKRTKIITLVNICFYRNIRILRHDQDIDNTD